MQYKFNFEYDFLHLKREKKRIYSLQVRAVHGLCKSWVTESKPLMVLGVAAVPSFLQLGQDRHDQAEVVLQMSNKLFLSKDFDPNIRYPSVSAF